MASWPSYLFMFSLGVAIVPIILKLIDRVFHKLKIVSISRIILALDQSYLCGYRISDMIIADFMSRFGKFNGEGFCYTFSAAIMLGLKCFPSPRLVRGVCTGDKGPHSWVEVRILGVWWVVDPCWTSGILRRKMFYCAFQPQIKVVYDHSAFWSMPEAGEFAERLSWPATSHIFVDLYWYYTPDSRSASVATNFDIYGEKYSEEFLPEGQYYLFPPEHGFKFSRRIVDDFMARPRRKRPKQRSLRLLERDYREIRRELHPAPKN